MPVMVVSWLSKAASRRAISASMGVDLCFYKANLLCFLQPVMPVTGGMDGFGQLIRIYGKQFFRCRILGKKRQGGFAKGVGKEFLVFREDLIQQGDDLALQVRDRIHDPEAVAAQLTQGVEVGRGDSGFTEASEADDLGDDERIPAVFLVTSSSLLKPVCELEKRKDFPWR